MSDIGFVTNPLLRHSAERGSGQIARPAADPKALTTIIAGEVPILRRNGSARTGLLPLADLDRVAPLQEQAFLGTLDGRPVWATLVEPAGTDAFRDDPA